jgi:hypothetical protein
MLLVVVALFGGMARPAVAQDDAANALAWIPGDVMLFGMLDMTPLHHHPALAELREWLEQGDADKGLDQFAEITGLDPRNNIEKVYVFGYPNDEGGAAIIEGSFDSGKARTWLENQFWVKKESASGCQMFQWWDEKEKKEKAAIVDGAHRIIFGDPSAVRSSAEAKSDEKPSVESDSEQLRLWKEILNRPEGMLSVVVFPDPDAIKDETLKLLKEASLTVDMGDKLVVELISGWTGADQAKAVADFALAAWNAHKELKIKPTQPELAELMNQVSISSSGTTATLSMAIPVELFANKIHDSIQK